jgi:hypothetical protein
MKWLLIIVLLSGSDPKGYKAFFGDTEAECNDAKAHVEMVAAARGDEIYAACYPWHPPVIDKTKPNDKKSEVTS